MPLAEGLTPVAGWGWLRGVIWCLLALPGCFATPPGLRDYRVRGPNKRSGGAGFGPRGLVRAVHFAGFWGWVPIFLTRSFAVVCGMPLPGLRDPLALRD